MAKKPTKKKKSNKPKEYTYIGKVYLCCQNKINVKNVSSWLSENAALDIDFETGDESPFEDGVGISIDWGSLKLHATGHK